MTTRRYNQQLAFWPEAGFEQAIAKVQRARFEDPVAYAITLEAAIEEALRFNQAGKVS